MNDFDVDFLYSIGKPKMRYPNFHINNISQFSTILAGEG